MTCVCGSGTASKSCCEPIVQGKKPAKTAEALMRSRYTAYTLHEIDYILNTCDPDAEGDVDRGATESWAKKAEWQGLEVVETVDGGAKDEKGTVEFIARYRLKGENLTHHERAEFRQIDDVWRYIDGAMVKQKTVVRDTPKVGRNEPCPCKSGKKSKKCCGQS